MRVGMLQCFVSACACLHCHTGCCTCTTGHVPARGKLPSGWHLLVEPRTPPRTLCVRKMYLTPPICCRRLASTGLKRGVSTITLPPGRTIR